MKRRHLLAALPQLLQGQVLPRWVVSYSDNVHVDVLLQYDIVVLDSRYYPPLAPLVAAHKEVFGYLSVGEVEKTQPYFAALQQENLLRGENPNWKGSYFVDLRDSRWERRVIQDLVPGVLRKGFRGIFLDTLDDAEYLESADPARSHGMKDAALRLVRGIRQAFPSVKLVQNRGFYMLEAVAPSIDFVLAESLYSDYDFDKQLYREVPAAEYRSMTARLQALQKANPALRVLTLDYWWPSDARKLKKIYKMQRANGFIPYVSTIGLDAVIAESERVP